MSSTTTTNIATFLNSQLDKLRQQKPGFSLRSMALLVGIPAGRLSELINGKRALSDYYADKMTEALKLSDNEKNQLYSFVSTNSRKTLSHREMQESEMALLSSWEYYAILNLTQVADFNSAPSWIAHRLGLPEEQVKNSLTVLEDLELIERSKDGTIKRTFRRITTTVDIPSQALRDSLKADLQKAITVIDEVSPELRDYSSITMPINTTHISKAKKLIESFQDRMSLLLEDGHKTEVYNLSIQLFPMTLPNKETKL